MSCLIYDRATLRQELVRDEGLKLKVYKDTVGKLTIGVGRNLDRPNPISAMETSLLGITRASCIAKGITTQQAMAMLDNDIDDCEHQLDAHWPWWRKLDGVRQRVILNMVFNMGVATLATFVNTLHLIQIGSYALAATNLAASKWDGQVGARADRLENMLRTGKA